MHLRLFAGPSTGSNQNTHKANTILQKNIAYYVPLENAGSTHHTNMYKNLTHGGKLE